MDDQLPQGTPVAGSSRAHELNAIGFRSIVLFAVGLIGTIGFVQVVLALALPRPVPPERPMIGIDQFPQPRLQMKPALELAQMRREERRRIDAYGWVDPKAGIAHIPIERAMDILAKRGLPKVAAPPTAEGLPPKTSIPPASKREEPRPDSRKDGSP